MLSVTMLLAHLLSSQYVPVISKAYAPATDLRRPKLCVIPYIIMNQLVTWF